MTLFDLVKQWLSEQPEFEHISRTKLEQHVVLVYNIDNPRKMILLVVDEDSITTSKGVLKATNPKLFKLLKKRILQRLRE